MLERTSKGLDFRKERSSQGKGRREVRRGQLHDGTRGQGGEQVHILGDTSSCELVGKAGTLMLWANTGCSRQNGRSSGVRKGSRGLKGRINRIGFQ